MDSIKLLENTLQNLSPSDFNILETISESVTGNYHKAFNQKENKHFIIKLIEIKKDESLEANIIEEIRILNLIEKETKDECVKLSGILKFFGFVKEEFAQILRYSLYFEDKTTTLENLMLSNYNLSFSDVDRIASNLLNALSFLQSIGISHQDIKPDNILLDKNLNATIFNFEIACEISRKQEGSFNTEIMKMEEFMSPEMRAAFLKGSQKCNIQPFKSDVFSLGLTILKLGVQMGEIKFEVNLF